MTAAEKLIKTLKRKEIICKSLKNFGAILVIPDWDQAAQVVNTIAPEHLELLLEEAETFSEKIHSAGAIFFGAFSCETVGDYFAGTKPRVAHVGYRPICFSAWSLRLSQENQSDPIQSESA